MQQTNSLPVVNTYKPKNTSYACKKTNNEIQLTHEKIRAAKLALSPHWLTLNR